MLSYSQQNTKWKNTVLYILTALAPYVCDSTSSHVYNFILNRTWRYHNLTEAISYSEFCFGHLNYMSFGLGYTRSTLFRSLKKLIDNGVILRYYISTHIFYGLNILGLLSLIVDSTEIYTELPQWLLYFTDAYSKHNLNIPEIKIERVKRMKLEEAIKKGLALSKKAKEKKREKLRSYSGSYTPNIVYALLKDFCDEYSISHTDRYTKKLNGMVKNWINDCLAQDRDIHKHLELLCKNWKVMCDSLKNDYGKKIPLSKGVNFLDYYKYQKNVDLWLEENANDCNNDLEVVYL